MKPTTPTTLAVRRGGPSDGPAVALTFVAARAAMTYLPTLHTPDEDRAFFTRQLQDHDSLLVTAGSEVIAFAVYGDGWLRHLYVRPSHQNQGLGTELLTRVQASIQDGLELWAFAQNTGARRFYERHGFTLVEETDGAGNEERQPDVHYQWTKTSSDRR